jgi:hypothetical protein
MGVFKVETARDPLLICPITHTCVGLISEVPSGTMMESPIGLINGARGTCPKDHTVDIPPTKMALGFWYCSECKEWYQRYNWKVHRFYTPSRPSRPKKELPDGLGKNNQN